MGTSGRSSGTAQLQKGLQDQSVPGQPASAVGIASSNSEKKKKKKKSV